MSQRNTARPQQVRIIAGRWRGRRIPVPTANGLRPTPDRVRETLFNWLAPSIRGARCLDLFAGTGVLAIEALSRGADEVCLVDSERAVVRQLEAVLDELGANASVVRGDALACLAGGTLGDGWDVVFVDPPYGLGCQSEVLKLLARPGVLAPDARVYVESAQALGAADVAPDFEVLRAKAAGQVRYHLLARV